jgi:trafficking protein particle complex subunit 9
MLNLERLCSVTGISRATIAGLLAQAHGPWLLHLGPRERLAVLETMAGIYACLGYKRKEAYILREVLGCVMDLLVCGREEHRGVSRSSPGIGGPGLGIRGVNFGDRNSGAEQGSIGVRHNDSAEGNDSILRLLKYVCEVLGINLEAVKLVHSDFNGHTKTEVEDGSSPYTTSLLQADDDVLDLSHDVYGWPELQIGVIREAIAVAESLPGQSMSVLSDA